MTARIITLSFMALFVILRTVHAETPAPAPIGWAPFCKESPEQCTADADNAIRTVLDGAMLEDLRSVNEWVNANVEPVSDDVHWGEAARTPQGYFEKWSLPTPQDMRGDCEDYAIMKRDMLHAKGWPWRNLLLAVVRTRHGEGHAVLVVKVGAVELVLDDASDEMLLRASTPYKFVKLQSQRNPAIWVWSESIMPGGNS